jgi:hypothetical protein
MITDLSACSTMSNVLPNKHRSEGVSRVCLSVILTMMMGLSLSACVRVQLIAEGTSQEPPQSEPPAPPSPTSDPTIVFAPVSTDPSNAPFCQLQPPITTVHKQENSAWCWAASTYLVISHLEPNRDLTQCKAVHITLEPEREAYEEDQRRQGIDVRLDCCRVTDEALRNEDPTDNNIIGSKIICHTTFRPEWALNALGYENRFQNVPGEGLTWEELTGQICGNLPFISVKRWDEGGTHSEVVTGYHFAPDAYVDLDTHGMDTFFSEPYDDYLGKPGDWVHVRDYVNIGL